MTVSTLDAAASPVAFRQKLLVRTSRGLRPFAEIEEPFQRDFLADLDAGIIAVRDDVKPLTPRLWLEGTKGSAKTLMVAMGILWLVAFCDRAVLVSAGASDRDQANEVRKTIVGLLRDNPWLEKYVQVQNWLVLNETTGSRCEILSSDSEGAHGARPHVVLVDELTHHGDDSSFATTVLDNSTKNPKAFVVITTNHGRQRTWQHDWRELARQNRALWKFHSFCRPAPWIDPAVLEDQRKRTSPSRYRRLWLGEWPGEDESALTEEVIDASVTLDAPQLCREHDDEEFFGGLDLGVVHDRSALVIVSRRPSQRIRLAYVRSWKPTAQARVNLADVEDALQECHARYQFRNVFYDPHQCEGTAQKMREAGIIMTGVPFTGASTAEMATVLLEMFNSGVVALYRHVELLDDLRQLQFVDKGASFRIDAQRTKAGHADTAFALALGLLAIRRHPAPWFKPFINRPIFPTIWQGDELIPNPLNDLPPDQRDAALQRELALLDDGGDNLAAAARGFQREQARALERARQRQPADPLAAILRESGLSNVESWKPDFSN